MAILSADGNFETDIIGSPILGQPMNAPRRPGTFREGAPKIARGPCQSHGENLSLTVSYLTDSLLDLIYGSISPMRLKDLPDWSRIPEPQSIEGILRGAKPSQLGHFVVLDIEYQEVDSLVLVRVSPDLIEKVLSVLGNHFGQSMRQIGELEIDV